MVKSSMQFLDRKAFVGCTSLPLRVTDDALHFKSTFLSAVFVRVEASAINVGWMSLNHD